MNFYEWFNAHKDTFYSMHAEEIARRSWEAAIDSALSDSGMLKMLEDSGLLKLPPKGPE